MNSILLPIFSILLCGSKTSYGWAQTSPKLFHLGNQNHGQFRQSRQFLQPTSNIPGLTSGLPGKKCCNVLKDLLYKGQEISEEKKSKEKSLISALASKKWLNQKNKGIFLYY